MEPFRYNPLDLEGRSFRLLRLIGNEDISSEIECELFEAWLGVDEYTDIPYEALSYTWGSALAPHAISLNGRQHHITENLSVALTSLRPYTGERILWVDALCIDQGCVEERGHQVGQMGDVFFFAEQVIFWLGDSNLALDDIFGWWRALEQKLRYQSFDRWPSSAREDWAAFQVQNVVRIETRHMDALNKLLQRPWFRRVWIMQEVANARRASVCVGRNVISSRRFVIGAQVMDAGINLQTQAVIDGMPGNFRHTSWWSSERDLLTLLKKFKLCEASDPRDKIYALLGITKKASAGKSGHKGSMTRPDYSKSIPAVIQDVVVELFSVDIPSQYHTINEFLANLDNEDHRMTAIILETATADEVFKHPSLIKLWTDDGYPKLLHAATRNKRWRVQIVKMIFEQHNTYHTGRWLQRTLMEPAIEDEDVAFLCEVTEDKKILGDLFRLGQSPTLELWMVLYNRRYTARDYEVGSIKAAATVEKLHGSSHAWVQKYLDEVSEKVFEENEQNYSKVLEKEEKILQRKRRLQRTVICASEV